MAGQTIFGQAVASRTVLSRSSASPQAALARMFAVAGATTSRSAQLARAICSTLCSPRLSHMETAAGLPLISEKSSGETNFVACSVITTRISAPRLRSLLTRSTAL